MLKKKNHFVRGDGRHEHPTQELLDEFSFLEHKDFDRSEIHVALIGDLFHGRTVHSKADGLQIFKKVVVDLVAPDELQMPPSLQKKIIKKILAKMTQIGSTFLIFLKIYIQKLSFSSAEIQKIRFRYVDKMKKQGFTINFYPSIDAYLAAGKVANLWYFTRLQLER